MNQITDPIAEAFRSRYAQPSAPQADPIADAFRQRYVGQDAAPSIATDHTEPGDELGTGDAPPQAGMFRGPEAPPAQGIASGLDFTGRPVATPEAPRLTPQQQTAQIVSYYRRLDPAISVQEALAMHAARQKVASQPSFIGGADAAPAGISQQEASALTGMRARDAAQQAAAEQAAGESAGYLGRAAAAGVSAVQHGLEQPAATMQAMEKYGVLPSGAAPTVTPDAAGALIGLKPGEAEAIHAVGAQADPITQNIAGLAALPLMGSDPAGALALLTTGGLGAKILAGVEQRAGAVVSQKVAQIMASAGEMGSLMAAQTAASYPDWDTNPQGGIEAVYDAAGKGGIVGAGFSAGHIAAELPRAAVDAARGAVDRAANARVDQGRQAIADVQDAARRGSQSGQVAAAPEAAPIEGRQSAATPRPANSWADGLPTARIRAIAKEGGVPSAGIREKVVAAIEAKAEGQSPESQSLKARIAEETAKAIESLRAAEQPKETVDVQASEERPVNPQGQPGDAEQGQGEPGVQEQPVPGPAEQPPQDVLSGPWHRGISQHNAASGDRFYSADPSVAAEFGKTTERLSDSDRPKNPLVVGGKEDLADAIGYQGDARAEPLDTPTDQKFDTLAKRYAQERGHDAIVYQNGTFDQPEMHVFGSERGESANKPVGTVSDPVSRPGEAQPHKFSSTQHDITGPVADEIRAAAARIPDQDLAPDGREVSPHLTVKYGIHTQDVSEVRKALEGQQPIRVLLGKTSLFENPEHDVVKVDVKGPALHALNKRIADALPHTDTHPDYKPHITLAYVKKGLGEKYAGDASLAGKSIRIDRITFSDRDGNKTEIRLGADQAKSLPDPATMPRVALVKELQDGGVEVPKGTPQKDLISALKQLREMRAEKPERAGEKSAPIAPVEETVRRTGLPANSPAIDRFGPGQGWPRDGDPKPGDTVAQTTKGKVPGAAAALTHQQGGPFRVIQSWRTAGPKAADEVLHLTLQAKGGEQFGVTGTVAGKFRITKAEPPRPATPEEAGRAMAAFVQEHDAADAAYNKIPESQGGKIVNTDLARELMPEYADKNTRAEYQSATSGPAREYARDRILRDLERTPERADGEPRRLLVTAGGAGSGKTTTLKGMINAADLVFDSQLRSAERAAELIEAAKAKGWRVMVSYVGRPIREAVRGAVDRATTELRSVTDIAGKHAEARRAMVELAARYKDDPSVEIRWFDNAEGSPNRGESVPREDLARRGLLDYARPDALSKEAADALAELRSEGRIKPEVLARFREGSAEELGGRDRGGAEREPEAGEPGDAAEAEGVEPSRIERARSVVRMGRRSPYADEFESIGAAKKAIAEETAGAAAVPQPAPAADPAKAPEGTFRVTASIDDLDARLATQAFSNTSHVPEKRGEQYRRDYVETFERVRDRLEPLAKTPEQQAALAVELERFRKGLIDKYRAFFSAHSSVASPMVTGPARFPVERNAKRMRSADARRAEITELATKAEASIRRNLFPSEASSISSDRADAPDLLRKQIEEAEKLHEAMLATNKIVRESGLTLEQKREKIRALGMDDQAVSRALKPDYMGRVGFPDYALQNNRANIKRMRDRVSSIESTRARDMRESTFDGGKIVENKDANRVQILFDGKPDEATRNKLKARGFRWSPSEGAWQRQLNEGAWRVANELMGAKEAKLAAEPKAEPKPVEARGDAAEWDAKLAKTPAGRQYLKFKAAHPDALILFRIGDFYEAFGPDAVTMHKKLGLTLTQHSDGVPMAGVPHHQLETYLKRLIGAGERVAVAEQVAGSPKGADVQQVVVPGKTVEDAKVEPAKPSRADLEALQSINDKSNGNGYVPQSPDTINRLRRDGLVQGSAAKPTLTESGRSALMDYQAETKAKAQEEGDAFDARQLELVNDIEAGRPISREDADRYFDKDSDWLKKATIEEARKPLKDIAYNKGDPPSVYRDQLEGRPGWELNAELDRLAREQPTTYHGRHQPPPDPRIAILREDLERRTPPPRPTTRTPIDRETREATGPAETVEYPKTGEVTQDKAVARTDFTKKISPEKLGAETTRLLEQSQKPADHTASLDPEFASGNPPREGIANLKAFLRDVPEFAIDPTFTVVADGPREQIASVDSKGKRTTTEGPPILRLKFKDGGTYIYEPKALGIQLAPEVKVGERIRLDPDAIKSMKVGDGWLTTKPGADAIPMADAARALDKVNGTKPSTKREPLGPDGVKSLIEGQKSITGRIAAAADDVAARAAARIKKRAIPRGDRTGAGTIIEDAIDAGMIVGAKLVKFGAERAGRVAKTVAQVLRDLNRPDLEKYAADIARVARRIVRMSRGEDGKFSADKFESAMADAQARKAGDEPKPKQSIAESTGAGLKQPKTLTESEAYVRSLRREERASRQGYAQARAEARNRADVLEQEVRQQIRSAGLRGAITERAKGDMAVGKLRTENELREEALQLVRNHASRDVRSKLLEAVTRATTPARLLAVARRLRRDMAFHDARVALREASKVGKKDLGTLEPELRTEADAAIGAIGRLKKELAGMSVKDLDIDRLEVIRDELHRAQNTVKALLFQQKHMDTVRIRGEVVETGRYRADMLDRLAKGEDLPKPERGAVDVGRFQQGLRRRTNWEYLAQSLDFGSKGGPNVRLFRRVLEGRRKALRLTHEWNDRLSQIVTANGYKSLGHFLAEFSGSLGSASQQMVDVQIGGRSRLTLGEAAYLYASFRDAGFQARMRSGQPLQFRDDPTSAPFHLTNRDAYAIEAALPENVRRLIDQAKAAYDSHFFERMSAVNKRLKGYHLEKVPGYFGIKLNRNFSEGKGTPYSWRRSIIRAMEESGFMQERVGPSKTPILIGDFGRDIINRGKAAATMIGKAEITKLLARTILHPDVQAAVTSKFGRSAVERLERRISLYSGGELFREADVPLFRQLQGMWARGKTQLWLPTWARNAISGAIRMLNDLPLRSARSILPDLSTPTWAEYRDLLARSPELRERWEGNGLSSFYDPGASDAGGSKFNEAMKAGIKQVMEAGKSLVRLAPANALGATGELAKPWRAMLDSLSMGNYFDAAGAILAYRHFKRIAPAGYSAEAKANWAARHATRVFERNSNTSTLEYANDVQLDSRESFIVQSLIPFTGDTAKAMNMIAEAHMKGGKARARVAAVLAAAAMASAGVTWLWKKAQGEDDAAAKRSALGRLAAEILSMIPFVGNMVGTAAQRGISSEKQTAAPEVQIPLLEVLNGGLKIGDSIIKAAERWDGPTGTQKLDAADMMLRAGKQAMETAGDATGLPAGYYFAVQRALKNWGVLGD